MAKPEYFLMRILHVIESLSAGGPSRSLIAAALNAREAGLDQRHQVVTLRKNAYPLASLQARQAGLSVSRNPDEMTLASLVEKADVVLVHYWFNPAYEDFLSRKLPAHRLIIWFHVLGGTLPQLISPGVLALADRAIVTSPLTLDLAEIRAAIQARDLAVDLIPGITDDRRISAGDRTAHRGFNVSYVGTAHPAKMHPHFVAMSARISVPGVRFIVCGSGSLDALRAQADQLGAGERFEFRGFVENVGNALSVSDVFGYPLRSDTYATSDMSLREAMLAAVPPVVFPHGGVAAMVRHQETGLVVHTADEYVQAVEYLYRHPRERRRLGDNARTWVLRELDAAQLVKRLHRSLQKALQRPKTTRAYGSADGEAAIGVSPAGHFATVLGARAPQFRDSLVTVTTASSFLADRAIAGSGFLLARGEGGIIHFRNAYPQAPALRLWSALVLAGRGQWHDAVAELSGALEIDPNHWRGAWYLGVATWHVSGYTKAAPIMRRAISLAREEYADRALLDRMSEDAEAAAMREPRMFPQ